MGNNIENVLPNATQFDQLVQSIENIALTSANMSYDNTTSELIATNVQSAIDELAEGGGGGGGSLSYTITQETMPEEIKERADYVITEELTLDDVLNELNEIRGDKNYWITIELLGDSEFVSGLTSASFFSTGGRRVIIKGNKCALRTYGLFNFSQLVIKDLILHIDSDEWGGVTGNSDFYSFDSEIHFDYLLGAPTLTIANFYCVNTNFYKLNKDAPFHSFAHGTYINCRFFEIGAIGSWYPIKLINCYVRLRGNFAVHPQVMIGCVIEEVDVAGSPRSVPMVVAHTQQGGITLFIGNEIKRGPMFGHISKKGMEVKLPNTGHGQSFQGAIVMGNYIYEASGSEIPQVFKMELETNSATLNVIRPTNLEESNFCDLVIS